MRLEMKIGIGIGVAALALGSWFFSTRDKENPSDTTAGPAPTDKPAPPPSAKLTAPAGGLESTGVGSRRGADSTKGPPPGLPGAGLGGTAGSPAPIGVREGPGRSIRPQAAQTPEPGELAGERTGLAGHSPEAGVTPLDWTGSAEASPARIDSTGGGPAITRPPLATPGFGPTATQPAAAGVTAFRPRPDLGWPTPSGVVPPPKPAVLEKPAGSPPAEPMRTHVIAPGETFTALAVRYFGRAKYAPLIVKANPDKDPRHLAVGAKVQIPPAPPDAAAPGTMATRPASPTSAKKSTEPKGPSLPGGSARTYTVNAGETWSDVARHVFGDAARWTELYEHNRGRVPRDPDKLPAGAVIELPPEKSTPTKGGQAKP